MAFIGVAEFYERTGSFSEIAKVKKAAEIVLSEKVLS